MTNHRETFNPKVDVCWQKQLRDQYSDERDPPTPHLDVSRARVRLVDKSLARQIIKKYEWLGTMSNTRLHYGIFFGSFCAGVTCVAVGTGVGGTNVSKMFNIDARELAILARGACTHWAPQNTNSKLVSWTTKLLRKNTDLKVLAAYSDSDAGEIGTIYQAANWYYYGESAKVQQIVAPNGRVYDRKTISNRSKQNGVSWQAQKQAMLEQGWETQYSNPKHRYCIPLCDDGKVVNTIEQMSQPYPKREDE
jgi:hypothetical protein